MRFFVLSFIFIAAFVSIILLVFNPKTNFMSRKAKLNQPGYEKAKKNVNIIIRIFILGMALLLLFIGIIPLVKDFMEYQKDNSFPQQIITVHKSSAQFGLSFFYQSLTIDEDGSTKLYYIYSGKPALKKDTSWKVIIAPNSRQILQIWKN